MTKLMTQSITNMKRSSRTSDHRQYRIQDLNNYLIELNIIIWVELEF